MTRDVFWFKLLTMQIDIYASYVILRNVDILMQFLCKVFH